MPLHHPFPGEPGPLDDDESGQWSVVSVVDPHGTGADVAFTDGLNAHGLPELALWARPSQGDDPGADWLLTHDERIEALEEWACGLLDGELVPGDVQRRSFDGGHAEVTFHFSPPIPAGSAGPLDLPPQRPVIVVGWSLVRAGQPPQPDPASPAVRRVHRWTTHAETITANWRQRGERRRLTERAGLSLVPSGGLARAAKDCGPALAGASFGPMTGWVRARIEQLLAAGPSVLADYLARDQVASCVRCEHCVQAELLALACRHGRGGPARESVNAASLVAMELTERLRGTIQTVLLAAAVADLAPAPLMASACGAWEWAVHDRPPGRAWLAPVSARRAVQELFTGPDGSNLLLPALAPDQNRSPGGGLPGRGLDRARVRAQDRAGVLIAGLQTVAAGSARPGWLLSARQRRQLTRAQVRWAEGLAAPLLTAVALPTRLPPGTWQAVTDPLRAFVPGLPDEPPGGSLLG